MAENKKSFILYADLIHTVRKMSKQKIGELFMTILSYVNDEKPEVKDKIVDLVFEPIKHQLKRDLERWDEFKRKQAVNGKLGGRPRLENQRVKKPKNPSLFSKTQKSPNVTVTVNDTVNVINKNIWIDEKKLFLNDYQFKEKICRDKNLPPQILDNRLREFLSDIELKEDLKELKELKRHFINWLNKNLHGTNSKNNAGSDKPGTSVARVAALKNWSSGGEISNGSQH